MKITIENKEYELDIEKAISDGSLKELHKYPLKAGDIYAPKKGTSNYNPLMLVKCIWSNNPEVDRCWNLLGLAQGAASNSGRFFESLHTKSEIAEYLTKNNLEFQTNKVAVNFYSNINY